MPELFDVAPRKPEITAIAPWFGSNRMLAHVVGEELANCRWVGVPFSGAMAELTEIAASTIVVGDLHRHVINLANVLKDPYMGPRLIRRLKREAFHPDTLADSQQWCKHQADMRPSLDNRDVEAARHYFVATWMGRSHKAGTKNEFNGGLSTRWNANGGDSNLRYRTAVRALNTWRRILQRCSFSVLDVFAFLDRCEDNAQHGIYCDPPFPGPGDKYLHTFTEAQQRSLAFRLPTFTRTRIVCRFYDHPLIRELYPSPAWTWRCLTGRAQTGGARPEVLLINGPSLAREPEEERLFA